MTGRRARTDTVTVTVLPSRVKSAKVNGNKLSVTFDSTLDTNSRPAGSAFTVTASKSGSIRTIAGTGALVGISDKTVTATLSAAVAADERLTVRYDKPASGNVLKEAAAPNTELPSFADREATNAGDTTAPSPQSAVVRVDSTITSIIVDFGEALDEGSKPAGSAFSVSVAGTARTLSAIVVSGRNVHLLMIGNPVTYGQTVTVSYTKPATNPLQDQLENEVADFGPLTARNVTPRSFSSASVNGSALTVTFNGPLDEDAVPAGSAFTVKGTRSGTEGTLSLAATNPVSISGSDVTLTLAAAVLSVDTVTVAYAAPAAGAKLQDADGAKHPVPDFSAQTVTNATPEDTTGPRLSSATVNGATVVYTFDEPLDESVSPWQTHFQVHVGGTRRLFDINFDAVVAGSAVTLRLSSAVTHGQTVTARYQRDSQAPNRVLDLTGNEARNSAVSATNNTPPAFLSATVNGSALTVTFDGALDGSAVPAGSAFTVKGTRSGTESTLSLAATNPVAVSGDEVTLTLAEAVLRTDTVTVAYAAPATGDKLQDSDNANHPVPDFAAQTATNNTPADTTGPTFVSASMNGTTLTVVFDETLAAAGSSGDVSNNRFRVTHGGSARDSTGVSISGATATATFAAADAPGHGESVGELFYLQSNTAADRLADQSGNAIAVPDGLSLTLLADPVPNVTPPAFSSASVNGDELTVTFDGPLDGSAVPAGSAFTVKGTRSGTESTLSLAATNPVAVSGDEVTLTLAEAVLRTDTVTVAYAAPATGDKLQDSDNANHPVPDFAAQTATNNTPADTTGPTFVSASMNGTTLTVVFDETLAAAGSSGDVSNNRFRVTHGGSARDSTGVSISGATATATFAAADAPGHGESVGELFYLQSNTAADRLADQSGNAIAVPDGLSLTLLADPVPNVTPPAFSSASVNGDELTVTFDGPLDGSAVPAGSAFTVKGTRSGTESTLSLAATNPVAVSGDEVTLTLAEEVLRVDTVTVAYAAPATGDKLQDADNANHPVPDFSAQTATNATPEDTTRPRLSSATVNGATVVYTFDEPLDESVSPWQTHFQVHVGGTRRLFDINFDAVVAGSAVTLRLSSAVTHGQTVTARYQRDSIAPNRVLDLTGNEARNSAVSATNNTPPAFSSATVDGDELTVTFDGALDGSAVPAGSAFTVKGTRSGTESTLSLADTNPVAVSGDEVTLTLAEAVLPVDTVTVAYAVPATGAKLQDADNANHPVPGFAAKTATNNTTDSTSPSFVSATVNGTKMTITFDEPLDETVAVPADRFGRLLALQSTDADSVSISGRTVTATFATAARHGQALGVKYRTPVDPALEIKDLSGNRVAGFIQPAANNTPPAFSSATVNEDVLIVTFDGALDRSAVPAGSAFTVKGTRSGTESTLSLAATNPVSVGGSTVTLALAAAVQPGDTVTVAYAAPATGAKLQDSDNAKHPVPDFSAQTVTNATRADTTGPALGSASVNGAVLTISFDEALDESVAAPAKAAFTVTAGESPAELAASGAVSVSGRTVTLTLAAAVAYGQAVTVGYDKTQAGGGALRDARANQADSFANADVTNATPAPLTTIVSVAIESVPSLAADTYGRDEHIRVKVTWSADVLWDVSAVGAEMAVELDVGGTTRTASLLTGGETSGRARALHFRYTVVQADMDGDGIAPLRTAAGDLVILAGGATLKDGQDRNASRGTGALGAAPDHKVNGSKAAGKDNRPPELVDASVSGKTLTLTFDEDLAVPDEAERAARALRHAFIIQGGRHLGTPIVNQSPNRVALSGPTVTLTLGTAVAPGQPVTLDYGGAASWHRLQDAAGNPVADLENRPVFNATGIDGPPPKLARATVEGRALTLFFDRGLDSASRPAGRRFEVSGNSGDGSYRVRGTGKAQVGGATVVVTLEEALDDDIGVAWIGYDKGNDASPLRGAAGGEVADIGAWRAAWLDGNGPGATSGSVLGTDMTLYFDEALDESSVPAAAAFEVQVAGADRGVDAVKVRGNAVYLTLASAAADGAVVTVDYTKANAGATPLRDPAGNEAADFSLPHKLMKNLGVEGHLGRPTLVDRDLEDGIAHEPPVANGRVLTFTFDEPLDPTTVPWNEAFVLSVNVYHGVNAVTVQGEKVALRLGRPLQPCDGHEDSGDDVMVSYAEPERNALRNLWGTKAESFGPVEVENERWEHCDPDGLDSAEPGSVILRAKRPFAAHSEARPEWFTVAASGGPVTVTGTAFPADDPRALRLTLSREFAPGETATVSYRRPLGEVGLWSVDGKQLGNVVDLPVTVGAPAAAPAVEAVTVASAPGADETYAAGDKIRVSLTFAETVDVDTEGGTPRLKLDLGGGDGAGERWAAYASGSGGTVLTFAYTVAAGDDSTEGVAVVADTLELDGGTIKSSATDADAALAHPAVAADTGHRVDTAAPAFASAAVSGTALTVTFGEALEADPAPAGGAFTATARLGDGAAREIAGTGTAGVDGAAVTVTLAGAVLAGETVTVAYAPPEDGPVRDLAGNAAAAFSGEAAANGTPAAPSGEAVAVVSDPGTDETYAAGDEIRVRLTFAEAVDVGTAGGTPRLKLDLDPADGGERWAAYAGGSGTNALTFAYTVAAGDVSGGGVAVLADTLELDGGTIRTAAGQADAALGHPGLAPDAAHRVDGEPPRLLRGEIDGGTVTLTFSEALDPASTGGRFLMGIQTSETASLGCSATGAVSVDGETVTVGLGKYCPPARAGLTERNKLTYFRRADGADGSFRDLAGNLLAPDGDAGTGLYVRIELVNVTGTGSSVTGVAVVSDAGDDDTYALGETIRVRVTFAEPVEVDTGGGTPRLTIKMDPRWGAFRAGYESGSGTNALIFAYRVAEPNTAPTGIAVLADTLETNGGTIRSAATGADVALGHAGLPHDPAHKVDWRLAPVPVAVTGVEVTSDAGADGAYTEGETVEAAVTFDAPVDVDTEGGVPTLALIANDGIRRAAYVSGSGTARLVFAYRAVAADESLGASVRAAASGLKLNGGAIAAAAGGTAASLAFGEAPGVTGLAVTDAPAGGWGAGDTVTVTLTFAEPVTVEGAPSVALSFGGVERRAAYARGSGGPALTFGYTLAGADGGHGAVGVVADSLSLGGGSIVSAGGGLPVALAHGGTGSAGVRSAPATVTGVAVVSDAGGDRTYGLGDTIRVRVTFDRTVDVTGSPRVKIKMDPRWGEFWAGYASGGGTAALTFAYTVVEPNTAPTGIAVLANTLEANGGTIASAGTQSDASLAHAGLAHDAAHRVDWRLAPPAEGQPSVTGVAVVSDAGSDDTYLLGDTIRVRLTFSEAVEVTGSPGLTIKMDPRWGEKRAVYEGATGTATLALTFAWTVVEPNYAPQGIAVLVNTLALNGGTIRSAATGADAALGHAGLGHDPKHKVDWRPVLSVADAEAREGVDEAVAFEVSLSRAFTGSGHRVRVSYATADGTATAGEDYTATSGTLVFVAGETSKTVRVPILDDGHDEGAETFLLRLSNVVGARAGDLEATGTIRNTDKMPKAWLARFGRTVAEQVVDAVGARLDAPRAAGGQATLGGQALPSWAPGSGSAAGADASAANDNQPAAAGFVGDAAARRDAERLGRWLAGTDERNDEAQAKDRSMTGREVLASTAFSLTAAPEDGGASVALWGRGASSSFSGRDGPLTVDGEVTSATLGADWRTGRWLLGAMVKHSIGEGSYSGDGGSGSVENTLTGIYPYAAVDVSARLRAWAAAGLGEGTLTLTPKNPETGEDDPALETDMSLGMAALGARGNLVEPADGSGFRLDLEADAFWVRTSSEKARGLAAAEADVTRLRLGLDGGYAFALPGAGSGTGDGGATLEPTFELGLRHDGGDAETGWGVDIGGGLRWHAPALGLSAEVSGRGLVAHEAAGLKDRGVSGSLAWDPDPASDRGPSLTLTQTLGAQAAGGADALLGRQTLADLTANDNGFESRRLELRLGYGLPALGDRFTSTPELGVALSDAAREYRLGWRLGLVPGGASSFELGIEASRKEPANDAGTEPEHGIRLKLEARF